MKYKGIIVFWKAPTGHSREQDEFRPHPRVMFL
jgi:hypothetical protein